MIGVIYTIRPITVISHTSGISSYRLQSYSMLKCVILFSLWPVPTNNTEPSKEQCD